VKVNSSVKDISQVNPLRLFVAFRRNIEALQSKIVPPILSNSRLSLKFKTTSGLAQIFNLKATSTSSHHKLAMVIPSFQYGALDYNIVEPLFYYFNKIQLTLSCAHHIPEKI